MSARFDKNIEADSSPIGIQNLLAEARDGDISAFRELYRIFFEKVYFLFYFMAEDSGYAELFTKEVFVTAWMSLADLDVQTAFGVDEGIFDGG